MYVFDWCLSVIDIKGKDTELLYHKFLLCLKQWLVNLWHVDDDWLITYMAFELGCKENYDAWNGINMKETVSNSRFIKNNKLCVIGIIAL